MKFLTIKINRSAIALLVSFGCLFKPLTAFALENDGVVLESYMRVVWGMLIVLGVMLLLYGFLRKRFSLYTQSPDQRIKIIEIKPLMQKKSLCLIEVNDEEYLLGISSDRIDHIAKLSPKANVSFAEALQTEERDSRP